ncbi:MAG: hypothetical protein M3442_08370 [Chloroflexota bacterium]|nr:hypothetical protein [Chloroflexota bacterium]
MRPALRAGGDQGWRRWLALGGAALLLGAILLAPGPAPAQAQAGTPTGSPTSSPTATAFVFDDADTYLIYSGNWNTIQDPRARSGTLHQARDENARLRMRFNGPYFKWFAVKGPNRGRARVTIDGVEIADSPFDLYKAGDPSYEQIVWQGGLDGERTHTLVIEVLGQRNGAATDSLIDVDSIEVQTAERSPVLPSPSITPTPAATATPPASPTPGPGTPVATLTVAPGAIGPGNTRVAGSWPIDTRFLSYYVRFDGLRILGNTVSPPTFYAGRFAQYFEKGRMEDHTGESNDPNWQFQYGLLVDELQTSRATLPVGGEFSNLDYSKINALAQEEARIPPPASFNGGTAANGDGSMFVPYSQSLQRAPGHNVSPIFWRYMNRADIFPGGWIHDIGLPMTEAIPAEVTKGTLANRQILVQVFQRTILTYDPMNPTDFQVERANVGTDYRRAYPDRVPQ